MIGPKSLFDQFMQAYPNKRPLMLLTLNECGVHKFICSLIRPSQMIYAEFYNWEGPTRFLSKYLDYEPLESATDWPLYLPSPSSTVEWSRGDCFDFSIALVSLLIGVGYDAFCVVGYAPIQITSNNQMFTLLAHAHHQEPGPMDSTTHNSPKLIGCRKYKQCSNPVLNAPYLAHLRHSRGTMVREFVQDFLITHEELTYGRTDEQDLLINYINERSSQYTADSGQRFAIAATEKLPEIDLHANAIQRDRRLHCWVMICSGKREVHESFFVEPTTGHHFLLTEGPYLAVDFVFSHLNVWVNLQSGSQSTARLTDMFWDFMDISRWEKILDNSQAAINAKIPSKVEECSAGAMSSSTSHIHLRLDSANVGAPHVRPGDGKFDESYTSDSPVNQEGRVSVFKTSRDTTKGTGGSPPLSAISTLKCCIEDTAMTAYHWLLPLTCAPKLVIPTDAFVTR